MVLQPAYCLFGKPGNEISYLAYVNPLKQVTNRNAFSKGFSTLAHVCSIQESGIILFICLEYMDLCLCKCWSINYLYLNIENSVGKL